MSPVISALQKTHPDGFDGFGGNTTPKTFAEAQSALQEGFELPWETEPEMMADHEEMISARAALQVRKATRSTLREQWSALPAWIRGPYRPIFDAANNLLDEGDDVAAAKMIAAVEPNAVILADETVYEDLGNVTQAVYFAAMKGQFVEAIAAL